MFSIGRLSETKLLMEHHFNIFFSQWSNFLQRYIEAEQTQWGKVGRRRDGEEALMIRTDELLEKNIAHVRRAEFEEKSSLFPRLKDEINKSDSEAQHSLFPVLEPRIHQQLAQTPK